MTPQRRLELALDALRSAERQGWDRYEEDCCPVCKGNEWGARCHWGGRNVVHVIRRAIKHARWCKLHAALTGKEPSE